MLPMQSVKVMVVSFNLLILVRNVVYGEHDNIDFMKFPIEILLEIVISFLCVSIGVISKYSNFEDIYVDKQNVEK